MGTVLSNRHLRALGITPWVRRSPPDSIATPAAASSPPIQPGVVKLNCPRAAVGTVIVEWPHGTLRLRPEDRGGSLLAGILGAIQQSCDSFQVLQLDGVHGLLEAESLPLSGSVVLCFVENWEHPSGEHGGREWLHLPSLQQMLSERQFKAQAWKQLRPLAYKLK